MALIAIRRGWEGSAGASPRGVTPVVEARAAHLGHLVDGRVSAAPETVTVVHSGTFELKFFGPSYSAIWPQVFLRPAPLISPVSSSSWARSATVTQVRYGRQFSLSLARSAADGSGRR